VGIEGTGTGLVGIPFATPPRVEAASATPKEVAGTAKVAQASSATDKLELSDRARERGKAGGMTIPSMEDEYKFYEKYMGKGDISKVAKLDDRRADLDEERARLLRKLDPDLKRPSKPEDLREFFVQHLGPAAANRISAIDAETGAILQERFDIVRQHISAFEESKSPQNKSLIEQWFMNLSMKVIERILEDMKATANS
jgi:hypothetical protein